MFGFKKTAFVLILLCAVSGRSDIAVFAASSVDGEGVHSVKERGSSHYSPVGGRYNSFKFFPSMDVGLKLDNNIYRQSSQEKSDAVTAFKPALEVSTDWSLHEVKAGVQAEVGKYWKHRSENYQDYSVYVSGVYDVMYGTRFFARASYDEKHEERGSPEDANGERPTEYSVSSAELGFVRDLSIFKLMLRSYWQGYEYDDDHSRGVVIDNSVRDRVQSVYEARLGYELSDRSELYFLGKYDRRRYDQSESSGRGSDGFGGRVGFLTQLSGKMKLDLYGGYMNTIYVGDFDGTGGGDFGGKFIWNISGITSITAELEKSIAETTVSGSSGIVRTVALLGVEHAFRENMSGDLGVEVTDSAYDSDADISRDNVMYLGRAGLDYLLSPSWKARAVYEYVNRQYDDSSANYDDHRLMVSVKYSY